jgi:hypothetical protein
MAELSRLFIQRIQLSELRAYRIAQQAGLHPATLSKLITGAERPKANDPRVLAVARVIGLPAELCFAEGEPPGDADDRGSTAHGADVVTLRSAPAVQGVL